MYIGMIGPGVEPEQTGTSDTVKQDVEVKMRCTSNVPLCKWPNVCKDLVSRRTMRC